MLDPSLTGHIRPVEINRDLTPIADLIETCFSGQMDEDGRDYLRHIRRAARDRGLQRWVNGSNERVSVPLFGYVWEERGHIVGNLSLIPFKRDLTWRYLIANVATHPDYRGRGIARQLTQIAIDHVRKHNVPEVWLQVRDDNPVAHHLYVELGFKERARRTAWRQMALFSPDTPNFTGMQVGPRYPSDWTVEERWLKATYPPEVAWNLNFNAERYQPGFWREMVRFFNNDRVEQWAVRRGTDLLGIAIWDAGAYNNETIWLAPNPRFETEALPALLTVLRRNVSISRPIYVNYPAGRGVQAFQRMGFEPHNTLIWMEIKLDSKS